jgi:glutaminyl-peptide cyclotransferase
VRHHAAPLRRSIALIGIASALIACSLVSGDTAQSATTKRPRTTTRKTTTTWKTITRKTTTTRKATTTRKTATPTATVAPTSAATASVALAKVKVTKQVAKDASGFTQGLEVNDGRLYESVGLYGASEMRIVDLATGKVLKRNKLDASLFAEGATFLPDGNLVQLTWREKTAIVRDPDTLAEVRRFTYNEEGWGICYSALLKQLVHSDGSSRLFLRDPATFAVVKTVNVSDSRGRPTDRLNELECSGGSVFANVWTEDRVLEIDVTSGSVVREIDATSLGAQIPNRNPDQVLNGIASLGNGRFLFTGKQWPTYFEVELVASR